MEECYQIAMVIGIFLHCKTQIKVWCSNADLSLLEVPPQMPLTKLEVLARPRPTLHIHRHADSRLDAAEAAKLVYDIVEQKQRAIYLLPPAKTITDAAQAMSIDFGRSTIWFGVSPEHSRPAVTVVNRTGARVRSPSHNASAVEIVLVYGKGPQGNLLHAAAQVQRNVRRIIPASDKIESGTTTGVALNINPQLRSAPLLTNGFRSLALALVSKLVSGRGGQGVCYLPRLPHALLIMILVARNRKALSWMVPSLISCSCSMHSESWDSLRN